MESWKIAPNWEGRDGEIPQELFTMEINASKHFPTAAQREGEAGVKAMGFLLGN